MAAAFPDAPAPWLDLSTGIAPFAYPLPDLPAAAWTQLPQESARTACHAAMARALGCAPDAVRAVAGTELAIRQLPALLGVRKVALYAPSYADHHRCWSEAGAALTVTRDPLAHAGRTQAVVVVDPNNPDGRVWPLPALEAARQRLAAQGGWLIVDEAYGDLSPAHGMAPVAGAPGLIVLRSFGKFFGLAGLRLGAVLAPPALLARLGARLGEWDVSGPALAIGAAAYGDADWQAGQRHALREAAAALRALIAATPGLEDRGGTDLFRYIHTPDAQEVWHRLARCGIAIRRFADDPRHVRIGLPGAPEDRDRLAAALATL